MKPVKIPVLTDIIELGDATKAELHKSPRTLKAKTISDALTDDSLNQQIEAAIDAVLPSIKRQLHRQLLSALTKSK